MVPNSKMSLKPGPGRWPSALASGEDGKTNFPGFGTAVCDSERGLVSEEARKSTVPDFGNEFNTHSFHFWLLDGQSGLPLNLNGIDVQFTFVCYKRNNYFNLRILDDQLKLIEENLNK